MIKYFFDRFPQGRRRFALAFFLLLGIALRLCVSRIGHNYDFNSWKIVGEIAGNFQNVYARTPRYVYGPIFFCVEGLLFRISSLFPHHIFVYRCFIILMLTAADLGIACFVFLKSNLRNALLFFLNPVSIIITGYHNQFDNIAILITFTAIAFINTDTHFDKRDILYLFFMSLGLITKHIFAFFLLWIFLNKKLPLIKRMAYTAIPTIIFLLSFLPFFRGNGRDGIINNVFLYKSFNNFPLLKPLLDFFAAPQMIYMPLFILLLSAAGYLLRNWPLDTSVLMYTICMVCFSSAIANQYLIIPLAALFIMTNCTKYIYCTLIGVFLMLHYEGLNLIQRVNLDISPCFTELVSQYTQSGYFIATIILLAAIFKYCTIFNQRISRLL